MSSILVSVIVPAFNATCTIKATVESILNQQTNFAYEVIVVDDGSTDETASIIKQFPTVKYQYQSNAGPASARNHGARLAQGEYLAFTDSDCVPHPTWLTELINGFTEDNIGIVCGSYGITNKESLLARCIHQEIIYRHKYLMPDFPKAFGGYNFCAKKNIYWQVGGFNEIYRRASGEDNDLSYKILQSGYRIYFNRQALVDHVHPARVLRYLKEQARHGYWRVMMYADHPTMAKGDDYTFWKDVLEMPLVIISIVGICVSLFSGLAFVQTVEYFIAPFLLFEIIFAICILRDYFVGIYFGFVFFFRAFARLFGLSTGILNFFLKKIEKKFK